MKDKMSIQKDLITVIIPVYNVELYLNKCVMSVINQTYRNLEIILVDDGSTDNSGIMCDEFAKEDKRIKVIHKKNGGLSDARNVGIDNAHGKYIGFVDSDDYIHADMYMKLYQAIINEQADMAICSYKFVGNAGNVLGVKDNVIRDEILDSETALSKLFVEKNFYYVTAWNRLYSKNILDVTKFPLDRQHEDEFTAHHFYGNCQKIVTLSEELYFYVQRSGSITNSRLSIKKIDSVYAHLDRYKYVQARGHVEGARIVLRQGYSVLLTCLYGLNVKEYKVELRCAMMQLVKAFKFDLRSVKMILVYIYRYICS